MTDRRGAVAPFLLVVAAAATFASGAAPCLAWAAATTESSPAAGARPPFPVTIGAPAPPLRIGGWLLHGPIPLLEPGKVTVVDSWASWCGPCKAVMPHLTELQQKYEGRAVVIGVDVFEFDHDAGPHMVEKLADKLGYAIARDSVPDGEDMNSGAFVREWLEGSGKYSTGIPLTFVVDRDGTIAWIGHPKDLDAPLDSIVQGTWDRASHAAVYQDAMRIVARTEPYKVAFYHALRKKDADGVAGNIRKVIAIDPVTNAAWVENGFTGLQDDLEKPPLALAFAKQVVREHAHDPRVLAHLASRVLRVKDRGPELTQLAMRASERAYGDGSAGDYYVTMVRGESLCRAGDRAAGLAMLDRALAQAKADDERSEVTSRRARIEQAK